MKKKILLFFIILFSIFLIPSSVFALTEGETKKLYMNINILDNGSLKVYEVASLQPSYNGRIRTLAYKNINSTTFTGKIEDFEGSSIYDANSISDVKIADIDINEINPKNLSKLNINKFYYRTYQDQTGSRGVYQSNITEDGEYYKIYNPSSSNRDFYMEYTYDNVAVIHNDVAEVVWNILGNNYEDDIEELIVYISLPNNDPSMRVWLRGPLDGNIKRVNDKTAKITYHNLNSNNAISFRMMFNKSLIPYSNKLSGIDGKENILAVEKRAAEKANKIRKKARLVQNTIKVGTILWYILLILSIIKIYQKKKELNKCEFNMEYLRDFPANYGPEIVEYLISNKITDKGMSASILNIINKGYLKVEEITDDKKNYTFIKTNDKKIDLTPAENKLLNMLIDNIGDGNKVTLKDIKNYSNSPKYDFLNDYNKWKNLVLDEALKEEFFIQPPFINTIGVVVALFGCFITIISTIVETNFIFSYLSLIIGIVTIIVIINLKYRSTKGVLHYKQWMALKKFMEDFGTMDEKELPELIVWEKYLVYATVLGCAEKLERDMKTRFEAMNITEDKYPDFYAYGYYHRMYLYDSLFYNVSNTVHSSYNNALSSSIASSSNSNSGGFGGGASFGGGSFGGGGGGGHF